jgi:hypothetical protein
VNSTHLEALKDVLKGMHEIGGPETLKEYLNVLKEMKHEIDREILTAIQNRDSFDAEVAE